MAFVVLSFLSYAIYDNVMYGSGDMTDQQVAEGNECSVLGINLHGTLVTYIPESGSADDPEQYQAQYGDAISSESIVSSIWQANHDDSIKALVLEIDSSGGYPVAGEEIAEALKESTKPTVAVIRQSGLSAAYWAATGAERIFASRNSDVGSIGVTSSYLENINKDKKYIQLSSGKFKDAGDPDRPITDEEKQLFMRDLKIVHQNFIEDVATNRNISIDAVKAIADGSSVLGDKALSLKLIDEIGGWSKVEDYLEQTIGEKPEVCWQ